MPEAAVSKPRRRAHNRQLNPSKVIELAEKQVSTYDIAKHQGVNQSSVWRFLDAHKTQTQQVNIYKANRADLFARVSGMSLGVIEQVVQKIQEDLDNGVLDALTPPQKSAVARDLNIVAGTIYDKERLERGQSTENVSVMGKLVAEAHGGLFRNQQVRGQVALPTEECHSGSPAEGDPSGSKPGAGGPERNDDAIG
jgi:hypothetical protein